MNAGFTYFELHTPDAAKARAFYGELLGWRFEDVPTAAHKYALIHTAGNGGGVMEVREGEKGWLPYVTVSDLEASVARTRALGGAVLVPPTPVPGHGRFSVVTDPLGSRFALWQEQPK